MEIRDLPPPCGEAGERSGEAAKRSGWGAVPNTETGPPPDPSSRVFRCRSDAFAGSTSPQGGGENIVAIARSWIGTPYVHQASVKGAGCDCLGLLRGVWRELGRAEAETPPPYSPDWAEARGEETLRDALARHLGEIEVKDIAPGDVALFRMTARGPAKHCGIIGCAPASLLERGVASRDGGLTLIHARQNKRVSEEAFTAPWRRKLAYAFRL